MMSRQKIKAELKTRADSIKDQVKEVLGDYSRDVDLSHIALFTVLFSHEMRHEPDNPTWAGRDRLVVSNLKVIPSLLAVLADTGYFSWREFHGLMLRLPKLFGNPHIAMINYPGVDFISNSPYMGMIQSLGFALSGIKSRLEYNVYHILDESRTPALQDVLMSSSAHRLNNFTSIIPYLDIQQRSSCIHFWFSMGWQLEEVRFDDVNNLFEGFARASRSTAKPRILLG